MYVKRDWHLYTERKVCPECIYYGECRMGVDCKALEMVVKIYENLDCGNPDE